MSELSNIPLWYVVQTKPKQEDRVNFHLATGGFETYFPRICKWKSNRERKNSSYHLKPLFPNYIFAKFNAYKMLQIVRFTRGVRNIVSLGAKPCSVDEEIINVIQKNCDEEGLLHIEKKFKAGDKVLINKPYLSFFNGTFLKELNDKERVSILLTSVNYQSHICIEKKYVEKVE